MRDPSCTVRGEADSSYIVRGMPSLSLQYEEGMPGYLHARYKTIIPVFLLFLLDITWIIWAEMSLKVCTITVYKGILNDIKSSSAALCLCLIFLPSLSATSLYSDSSLLSCFETTSPNYSTVLQIFESRLIKNRIISILTVREGDIIIILSLLKTFGKEMQQVTRIV